MHRVPATLSHAGYHSAHAHQRSCQARPPQWNGIRLHDAQGTRNLQPRRLSLGTHPSKQRSSTTSSGGKSSYLNGTAYASTTHRVSATLSHAGYRAQQHSAHAHQRSGQARPPQWNGIRLHDAQGTRNPQPRRLSLGTHPSKQRSSATSSGGKSSYLNGTAYVSTTHRVPATLSHSGYRAKPIKGAVKRDLKWWQEFLRP
jgi:hypothetical protein